MNETQTSMETMSNRSGSTPRNLCVFADGTGQDGGVTDNTNIYKMFAMAEDRTPRQLCYYHAGVGTERLARYVSQATGLGFAANVRACYEFLHEEFRAGDRIFLFGFSRGAATVRSLAYFIHLFGILPRSRRKLLRRAWRIYAIRDAEERQKQAKEFIENNPTMWTNLHFVGCYDTVAALGAPFDWASKLVDRLPGFKHRFHNLRLSPCVLHAYHALALDDERKTFHPLLWDPLESEANRQTNSAQPVDPLVCKTLLQVWFPGMHSDVGGGYREQALSDIPLTWLTNKAVDHGFHVYEGHRVRIAEDPNGVMHDARAGFKRIFRRARRSWDKQRPDRPILHVSVGERNKDSRNQDGQYVPWLSEHTPSQEPWVRYGKGAWK